MKRRPPIRGSSSPSRLDTSALEPFWAEWQRLTPFERLRRSWAMRRNLKDPIAAHDERSLPKL